MTKYQSSGSSVVEGERESSSDCVLCSGTRGRRNSKIWGEEERGSRYMGQHRNIIHMMMGGGGGGVVCPLSSAGHRSHCIDTVQPPMG